MKKIIIILLMKKKKKFGAERIGLLPNYIVKKKFCIAIQFLYCREGSLEG